MRLCLEKVRAARWPLVFTYVYDEYWQIVRAPSIRRLFEAFFRDRIQAKFQRLDLLCRACNRCFRLATAFRCHRLGDASAHLYSVGAVGRSDGGQRRCMYVIPRSFMPATMPPNYGDLKTVTRDELRGLLQGTRALPAQPGAAMGWNHQLNSLGVGVAREPDRARGSASGSNSFRTMPSRGKANCRCSDRRWLCHRL